MALGAAPSRHSASPSNKHDHPATSAVISLGYSGPNVQCASVQVAIASLGLFPPEITRHRFAHHPAPCRWIVVLIERSHCRVHELLRRVAVEQEASHAVLDRIRQSTDAPRHRNSSITLRTHLRQSAGLVL